MKEAKDLKLWQKIKKEIEDKYNRRWNAYYSGLLVKEYKKRGGEFKDSSKTKEIKPLKRWFLEKWQDVGNNKYPVYRPTKRINKKTPLTIKEIDKEQLKKQIKLKQKIKGNKNLPKFI